MNKFFQPLGLPQVGLRCALPVAAVVITLGLAAPMGAEASSLFSRRAPAPKAAQAGPAADLAARISQALDERRYVDAGNLLDQAQITNIHSPELTLMRADWTLYQGRFADALAIFRPLVNEPAQKARALQGVGMTQSMLGRSEEALEALKQATALDKTLWMAWNALGREYDLRRDWAKSKAAYAAALAAPGANTAVVLNNRGFSALLQNRTSDAEADFVLALDKDPALAAARTNLRLSLAIDGHYQRAAATGVGDDRAAVLNNVGLAAAVRGDFTEADKLLNQAIAEKGQFYGRAAENLQLSHDLETRFKEEGAAPPDVTH